MTTTLRTSLAFINVPSDQPTKSRAFFEQLLGIEMVPSLWGDEGYHAPISADGIDIGINVRHMPQESTTAFLSVADLDSAIQLATKAGGKVLWGPEELEVPKEDVQAYQEAVREIEGVEATGNSVGRAAIVVEPGGSQIGVIELQEHNHQHFAVGKHQQPLTAQQTRTHQRSIQNAKQRVGAR